MLKIVQQVMFVHVLKKVGSHYMLNDLAQNTSEGDRSVVYSRGKQNHVNSFSW